MVSMGPRSRRRVPRGRELNERLRGAAPRAQCQMATGRPLAFQTKLCRRLAAFRASRILGQTTLLHNRFYKYVYLQQIILAKTIFEPLEKGRVPANCPFPSENGPPPAKPLALNPVWVRKKGPATPAPPHSEPSAPVTQTWAKHGASVSRATNPRATNTTSWPQNATRLSGTSEPEKGPLVLEDSGPQVPQPKNPQGPHRSRLSPNPEPRKKVSNHKRGKAALSRCAGAWRQRDPF